MNAEALIGTVLGTCTLQRLIGQGGMGAVYLAQQSRPRRQVAVKILLPATTLKPHQLPAFRERFRRETDAAASLEHPNIMPVHEYGEQEGLAYLVMPYISGGTLRDVMEREGPIALPKALGYLEQMAAALDFAHERGVIHRDVKPANMLLTPEGRLLLTDFGLVKILSGTQTEQARLTGAGAPVGTPDYMSPEQVMGNEVDGRADLYSLGIILYQMVTGVTPFQGETPMQIAVQHLQVPPVPPRMLRTDLPEAVEAVILKGLEKRPDDRYARGQDMATAFRQALITCGIQPDDPQSVPGGNTGTRLYTLKAVRSPSWQTGALPTVNAANEEKVNNPGGALPGAPKRSAGLLSSYKTGMLPAAGGSDKLPAAGSGTTKLTIQAESATGKQAAQFSQEMKQMSPVFNRPAGNPATPPEGFPTLTGTQQAMFPTALNQMSPLLNKTTGSLAVPNAEQAGAVKLTGPVKVVQVPIAGQPGQFMTGLLPVIPELQASEEGKSPLRNALKIIVCVVLVLLIILGSVAFLLIRTQFHQSATSTKKNTTSSVQANPQATANAQASATAQANIILSDSLSQNIHNWPTSPSNVYAFRDGAYHITDRGNDGIAVVLQASPFTQPIAYTLTMQQINGDDGSPNNSFGMILRFNQQTKGGKNITTFYSFEVVNTASGEYRFYKYDNSQGTSINPWTMLWHQSFGKEFHRGHSINTFKIFANGNSFTFIVNGKDVGSFKDNSFKTGTVGMLVNLNGTEIAFSNLLITRNP